MAVDEIFDISLRQVRHRRQVLLRVGLPLLGVALVIVSILGVSLYGYEANRAGALMLSQALLDGLQARIAREVGGYLSPATQAALIARDMVARDAIPDGQAAIEGFAASMLNQVPNLEGFYAASGNGDFTMVRRDVAGGTDTKLITNEPNGRGHRVSSEHRDPAGQVVDRTSDPADDFDPRTRVWYQGALRTDGVFWSSPYIFYTTRAPGITAAIRFTRPGSPDRVFGVDITLKALSGFLASLPVGRTGRAAIVERSGTVIAAPELAAPAGPASADRGSPVQVSAADLADPVLAAAYDRYRVEGYGSRTIAVGATRYVAVASRLPAADQDWVLLMVAPQSDFTAFAEASSRKDLLLSLVTIGLATLLGLLLVRQNRRADRMGRMLARSREDTVREGRALSALAAQPGLFDPGRAAPGLTEGLAEMSDARRASIWRLVGGGRTLRCDDSYDQARRGHVEGLELSRSELPQLFGALDQGEAIEGVDAAADRRTSELHRLLMQPFGSRLLSVLPVLGPAGLSGLVLLEDAERVERARGFAQAVSSIVAMRMADASDPAEDAAEDAASLPADVAAGVPDDAAAFSALLSPSLLPLPPGAAASPQASPVAALLPAVAVMVIRLDEALALVHPAGDSALAEEIASALQAIAVRHALPYMKLAGTQLVAAAGLVAAPEPGAALRLADAALAARETCLRLLAQAGVAPDFRIGIDAGPALGCALGQAPRLYNLWGGAVRTAELMAQSATEPGSIQVSEAAYGALRQHFLFRTRGVFYLPGQGPSRTFTMAGRR